MISQIELISGILGLLEKHGPKGVNERQMNAVIAAANDIMAELNREHRPAKEGMSLTDWWKSDDTGLSSRFMAYTIGRVIGYKLPIKSREEEEKNHPHDPSDFGRCYRLLKAVPECRPYIARMAEVSKEWAALVGSWEELERLFEEESPAGIAPKLYARMKELLGGAK